MRNSTASLEVLALEIITMDIATIESVLKKSNVNYKILTGGINIKFGLLAGSFFVKYDKENDNLVYGNKYRWVFNILYIIVLGFIIFLIPYVGLVSCFFYLSAGFSLLSIVMKEIEILKIKKLVLEANF